MNLKSKILGTLAASALALSMMGSVATAADSDSTSASAVLKGKNCSVVATSAIGFGTWTYDGTQYLLTSGTDEGEIAWTITAGNPSGCDMTVNFHGLQNDSSVIGLGYFHAGLFVGTSQYQGYANGAPGLGDAGFTASGVPTGSAGAFLKLLDVPETGFQPGTYSGTVSATVSNTQ